jgi:hypothetical protein
MAQTVIGFFDDVSDAQRAVDQLQSRGVSRDRIDVSRGSSGAAAPGTENIRTTDRDHNTVRVTSEDRTVDKEGRNTNRITDFFNSLFQGGENDDANRYSRVAERAGAIVTVHAQSKEEAESAADILDDCGAVDVDERASQYGFSGTRSTERTAGRQSTSARGGGTRMRSRIIDRPVAEQFRLREENYGSSSGRTEGRNPDRGSSPGPRNTDV